MAKGLSVLDLTFEAGADLSSDQFKFVKFSSGQVVLCTADTDISIGVLQNAPDAAGKAAVVRVLGVSKVDSGAALSVDDLIGPAADGQGEAKVVGTDTDEYIIGRVIEASSAAGEEATALINAMSPCRAA